MATFMFETDFNAYSDAQPEEFEIGTQESLDVQITWTDHGGLLDITGATVYSMAQVDATGEFIGFATEVTEGTSRTVRASAAAGAPPPPAPSPAAPAPAGSPDAGDVTRPLAGSVLDVKVQAGDTVALTDTLLVLEAMKMESNVASPRAGTVAEVLVGAGDAVTAGQGLVKFS